MDEKLFIFNFNYFDIFFRMTDYLGLKIISDDDDHPTMFLIKTLPPTYPHKKMK
jgi:hypothetical protein